HYRAIVHRVIENRSCQDQAIEQCHRQAKRNSLVQFPQHATRSGTVNVQVVALAPITGRNHKWLLMGDETYMAEKTFIKNRVSSFPVVDSAFGFANHTSAWGWQIGLGHFGNISGKR